MSGATYCCSDPSHIVYMTVLSGPQVKCCTWFIPRKVPSPHSFTVLPYHS